MLGDILGLARLLGAKAIDCRRTHVLAAWKAECFAPDNIMDTLKQKVGIGADCGQTHRPRDSADLLRRIEEGEIDTTFLISHRLPLEDAPRGYANRRDKQDEWTKVVRKPGGVT